MLGFPEQAYTSQELHISPGQSTFWRKFIIRALVESIYLFDFIVYLFSQS